MYQEPSIHPERVLQFNGLKHFCACNENGARAQQEEYFSDAAGILEQIILPAFYRAQSEGVGDKEDLQFGLDREQARDFFHS